MLSLVLCVITKLVRWTSIFNNNFKKTESNENLSHKKQTIFIKNKTHQCDSNESYEYDKMKLKTNLNANSILLSKNIHNRMNSNSNSNNNNKDALHDIYNNSIDDFQWLSNFNNEKDSQTNIMFNNTLIPNDSVILFQNTYYDIMSKNLDANLAEADIENFKTEDIHSILNGVPTFYSDLAFISGQNQNREMIASLTNSLISKLDFNSSMNTNYSESVNTNNNSMSLSKSDLLFSSIKDEYGKKSIYRCYSNDSLNDSNVRQSLLFMSINSLDDEQKNYLYTCHANKNNYTITFEENDNLLSSLESNNLIKNGNLSFSNRLTTWKQLKEHSKLNFNRNELQFLENFKNIFKRHRSFSLPNLYDKNSSIDAQSHINLLKLFKIKKMYNNYECQSERKNHNNQSVQTSLTMNGKLENESETIRRRKNLTKLDSIDTIQPIYVLYPNYALPNLEFLSISDNEHNDKIQTHEIAFIPKLMNFDFKKQLYYQKSYSVNNLETMLKNVNSFQHIYDWDSLNFLLSPECKQILEQVHGKQSNKNTSISENNATSLTQTTTSSTSTSGYKGSSITTTTATSKSPKTIESNSSSSHSIFNPLFVYKYEDNMIKQPNNSNRKNILEDQYSKKVIPNCDSSKRKTFPINNFNRCNIDITNNYLTQLKTIHSNAKVPSSKSLNQFDKYLEQIDLSELENDEQLNEGQFVLKSYVKNFLQLDINKEFHIDENVSDEDKNILRSSQLLNDYISQKINLVAAVFESINLIAKEENQTKIADLILKRLSSSLYAIFSDGLKLIIESPFGILNNSIWQVIEAFAHQDDNNAISSLLYDLVLKINSNAFISNGLLKFNAFIFGLINIKSLHIWFKIIRSKKNVIQKFYEKNAFLFMSQIGIFAVKKSFDELIIILESLSHIVKYDNFNLFYEFDEINDEALKRSNKLQTRSNRPRSLNFQFLNDYSDQTNICKQEYDNEHHLNCGKFKKLQMKWEKLSTIKSTDKFNQLSNITDPPNSLKSKIPRPISTPLCLNHCNQQNYKESYPKKAIDSNNKKTSLKKSLNKPIPPNTEFKCVKITRKSKNTIKISLFERINNLLPIT